MSVIKWFKPKAVVVVSSLLTAGTILFPHQLHAQLPSMSEPPWTGFFSGYQQRDYEFGINNEGVMELYLMTKKKERVGHTRTIKIYPQVLIENDQGKRFYRSLNEDEGFATEIKPSLEHKEVKFTGETKGGVKLEINVKYDRSEIILDGKVLDKGDIKDPKVYFSYKVKVPAMYTSTYKDEDKAKSRMRKDKVRFIRAKDGKRVTLKSYEEVDVLAEENAKDGVRELEVDMDGQEGKKLIFGSLDEKSTLIFTNRPADKKGKLWEGYEVLWLREMGDASAKPFVIEVK
ncbi:hypothetical protein [Oceaniferula spumae]